MNRPRILHEIVRVTGHLARAILESNNVDFIRAIHELRTLCDVAIQHHTFKVHELERDVEDDEL